MEIKIAKFFGNARGALSFTFDDGCYKESTLKTIEIFKMVEAKTGVKIKATSAQTVGFLHEGLIDMWKIAIEEGYYDICSHSVDHCIGYNDETPEEKRLYDAEASRDKLSEIYGVTPICFAIPGGGESEGACQLLSRHYYANRVGEGPINDPDNLNFMRLTSFIGRLSYENVEPCVKFIDEIIACEGYGIQINHWLTDKEQDVHHAQRTHVFEDECLYAGKLASEGKLWIASLNDAVKYFYERNNAKITTQGDEITIKCDLDASIFNHPLTLVITADAEKSVKINGAPYELKVGENVITIEMR
ncbi:MAG: polysaccharide deacetylase family protein [Clostridia bacterium]|nr:polysaccharide deacetylase family protein [Clostridia bacterium]